MEYAIAYFAAGIPFAAIRYFWDDKRPKAVRLAAGVVEDPRAVYLIVQCLGWPIALVCWSYRLLRG